MKSFLSRLSLLPGESFRALLRSRRLPAVALAASVAIAAPLQAFWEVARGEVILNTTVQAAHDSNLFARRDAPGDLYFSLIPELQFLRQAGKGTIDLRTGVNLTRFMDLSDEDFEDFYASLGVTYPTHPDSPLSGEFSAAYTQFSGAIDLVNTRVRTETSSVGADTLYRFSERLALRNALFYEYVVVEEFSNVESYGGSLGLQWVYSEKLSFFSDYRLRQARSTGENPFDARSVNNLDHALLFGATGVLRPRIDGTVSVGYQQTDARGAEGDRGLLIAAAELDWAWRPRTSLSLSLLRDADIAPTDETIETTTLSLSADHDVDEKIRLTGLAGFRHFDYRGGNTRRDNAFLTGLGLRYIFTRYWNAGADYQFTLNTSNMPDADYTRHLVQIFTRYSF